MATREEIREGILNWLLVYTNLSQSKASTETDRILRKLHSQGVVIKVEGELPRNTTREVIAGDMGRSMELRKVGDGYYERAQQDILNAGYVSVESLIKEGE